MTVDMPRKVKFLGRLVGLVLGAAVGLLWMSSLTVYEVAVRPPDFAVGLVVTMAAGFAVGSFIDHLRWLSVTDPLTGLFNRRIFLPSVERAIVAQNPVGSQLALVFFDIDSFKEFNDLYGHLFGDKLLCAFAKILTDNTRSADVVVRWGGEEFAVLLKATTDEGAQAFAERIRETVAAIDVAKLAQVPVCHRPFTVSAGVVTLESPGLADLRRVRDLARELTGAADAAMYRAKTRGNSVMASTLDPNQ